MAIRNLFIDQSRVTRWLLAIAIIVGALVILWYAVPEMQKRFAPKQEVPAEVKVPMWQDTLPPAPKKHGFTIPVVSPPKVVGMTLPATNTRSKK